MSEDEEHWGGYQKDRICLDNADNDDIWLMDDRMTFALDGEGYGEESDGDGAVDDDDEGGEGKDGDGEGKSKDGDDNEIAWEYDHDHDHGPQGRTRFDEYYDARKAKNKKRKEGMGFL